MTEDEVIQMAREAGVRDSLEYDHMECNAESLERFAKLVAAAERDKWMERAAILIRGEREACAKLAEAGLIGHTIAKAIRARGDE